MISRLTGKLIEKQLLQIVIDVNGVAYEADVSMQTFYNLPPLNETVQLYTQLVIREDAHLLFGFGTAAERATFRQMVKVSGIGAKTAERMILELRGKLSGGTVSDGLFAQPQAADETDDIIGTLLALGYSDREARTAVKGIAPGTEVGEGVRLALKNLLK